MLSAPWQLDDLEVFQLRLCLDAIVGLVAASPAAKQSLLRAGLPGTISQLLRHPHTVLQAEAVTSCFNIILRLLRRPDCQQAMLKELGHDHKQLLFNECLSFVSSGLPGFDAYPGMGCPGRARLAICSWSQGTAAQCPVDS